MENCSHVATGKILGIPRNSKICQLPHDISRLEFLGISGKGKF